MNEGEVFGEDRSDVFTIDEIDTYDNALVLAFWNGIESPRYSWSSFRHITSLQGWSRISDYLTVVNVSGNNLTSLGDLSPLSSLVELNCARNKLTSLGSLSSLVSLQVLKCYQNSLNKFEGLSALTTLEYLVCYENRLGELTGLEHLCQLRELDCHSNGLTSLDGMPLSVQMIRCSGNSLRYLPDLHDNENIIYIDTSKNRHLPADMSVHVYAGKNRDPGFVAFLQRTTYDKWRWHCQSTVVVVLAVAKTRRSIRDVLGLIARAAWEMRKEERFFTQ